MIVQRSFAKIDIFHDKTGISQNTAIIELERMKMKNSKWFWDTF